MWPVGAERGSGHRRGLGPASALATVALLAACTPSPDRSVDSQKTAPQQLMCNRMTGVEPTPNLTVYFDEVALPTSENYPTALQVNRRTDDTTNDVVYFAKEGLLFRGDKPITVSIVGNDEALLNFEGRAQAVTTATGCGDDPDQWNVIIGGYLVPRPTCLTVLITAGADSSEATIGVGKPCPGQEPPPQPSDA